MIVDRKKNRKEIILIILISAHDDNKLFHCQPSRETKTVYFKHL